MKGLKSVWVWFVVIVIYCVGLVGFMVPASYDLFVWLIPINILFSFIILLSGEEEITISKLVLFIICFLFGYFIELIGTKTGVIFGQYQYGKGLGWSLFSVPLLIGVNWFFMVYTSLALSLKITQLRWLQIMLAPGFMVLYDYFLEPFAIKNDMWNWGENIIPIQNYIAWYLGGLFLSSIAIYGKFNLRNRFAAGLFIVQVLFFIVLYICGI